VVRDTIKNRFGDLYWCLLVSQFTLLASTKKGSKPDFHGALGGDQAKELYQYFVSKVQQGYSSERVKDGVFQAMMVCAITNH
jgi:D-tyrosyl-tRNA(Tyr) deacylase